MKNNKMLADLIRTCAITSRKLINKSGNHLKKNNLIAADLAAQRASSIIRYRLAIKRVAMCGAAN